MNCCRENKHRSTNFSINRDVYHVESVLHVKNNGILYFADPALVHKLFHK